jgi:P27 family predicted phage terminase small subunit
MARRKSNVTKALDGNPGKREALVVKPPPGVPEKPAWLKGEAADEWDRIVPILDSMGVLSTIDRAIIALHCQDWQQLCKINADLEAADYVSAGRTGEDVRNPLWAIKNQLEQRFHKTCELLGAAPNPRSRLDMPPKEENEDPHGLLD